MPTQTPTPVQVYINLNAPFTPELLYSIKQTLDDKYSVDSLVIPKPNTSAPVEVEGDLDATVLANIQGDATMAIMQAATAPKAE